MREGHIRRFFEELDRRIKTPIRVLLTGGAAGVLQGVERVTYDIDFELKLKTSKKTTSVQWEALQKAIEETSHVTGIAPQYAEDIDRWSSIVLPVKKSRLYLKIGKVEVRLLDPGLWAIGKLSRYLSSDLSDLQTVLKSSQTNPYQLARLWGKALGLSPVSNSQGLFRRQVEQFFDQHALSIWGARANPTELKTLFIRHTQKAKKERR